MNHTREIKKYAVYLIYSLIAAFIAASGFTLLCAIENNINIFLIESVEKINTFLFALIFILIAAGYFSICCILKNNAHRYLIPLSVFLFSILVLFPTVNSKPYHYIALAVAAICVTLAAKGIFEDKKLSVLEGRGLYIFVGAITVTMVAIVSFGTIIRMYVFNNSTFDFGLFAQMYEYMATDFTQNSTLERNELLSHFAVHFSPIYYLLLPFYMLFRCPEALLVMQAAVCFSGVIPLLLLCRHWRYSGAVTLGISAVFLCYPPFTGACFYDFHENCFLVPIILWLLYFTETNKKIGMAAFALLLLCVKEDAGLYLIFIALYGLTNKKLKKRYSAMLLIIGVVGFIAVTGFINAAGEGIKVSRYSLYLTGNQDSLTDVVKNVLKNPSFFFSNLLNEQKLIFLLQMLLPLLFVSFGSRKLCDWFLIVPFILINLATDYKYQYDMNYQYVFGTGAMLVFLFAKNLRYFKKKKLKISVAAFMAAAICLVGNSMPKYHYADHYFGNIDRFNKAEEILSEIPRDKVIYASTFLTPHLYDCKELYMYPSYYNQEKWTDADYIVLDNRAFSVDELNAEFNKLSENGYVLVDKSSFVTVYARAALLTPPAA